MKKVLILSVLAMLGMASIANADNVNAFVTHNDFDFTVSSYADNGMTIYYNADSVEQFTYDMLARMGATNISVNVMNGMGNELVFMPAVSVQFDSLRAVGNGTARNAVMRPVRMSGDAQGMLAPSVFEGVKDHFDISDLSEKNTEIGGYYSYDYRMNTLFAQ